MLKGLLTRKKGRVFPLPEFLGAKTEKLESQLYRILIFIREHRAEQRKLIIGV